MSADLAGQKYGRWTFVEPAQRSRYWVCECSCGARKKVFASSVTTGKSTSCGCASRESSLERFTTHGHSRVGARSREYETWCRIRARCDNQNAPNYSDYGGRGIRVCERWGASFDAFLSDMGCRPGPGYSIDRVDNNGNYEPGNCRWATAREQANNRRSSAYVELNGKRQTQAQWARELGVHPLVLSKRKQAGLSAQEILAEASR